MNDELVDKLRKEFAGVDAVTKKDIYSFSEKHGLALTDGAIRKRIHSLTKKGVLKKVKRSVYSFKSKVDFTPDPDYFINKARKLFTEQYSEIEYCIWSSSWLHEFMAHQPFTFFYIFETEKDMLQTSFELFKDNNITAFLDPDRSMMVDYVGGNKKTLIIKLLNARSPKITIHNNQVPAIEKILTDIYCDRDVFYFYHGEELKYIFENAINKYNINFSSLLNYADVRERKSEITNYLKRYNLIDKNILK